MKQTRTSQAPLHGLPDPWKKPPDHRLRFPRIHPGPCKLGSRKTYSAASPPTPPWTKLAISYRAALLKQFLHEAASFQDRARIGPSPPGGRLVRKTQQILHAERNRNT